MLKDLNVERFVNEVCEISKSPTKYKTLVDYVIKIHIKSISEMVEEYQNLYQSIITERIHIDDSDLRNNLLFDLLKLSSIIHEKEAVEGTQYSFSLTDTKKSALGHKTLSIETWKVLDNVFPPSKFGKGVKLASAFYIHLAHFGFKHTVKKAYRYLKDGKTRVNSKK